MRNSLRLNKFKHVIKSNFTIILLFAIFSIISSAVLLKANFVGNSVDLYFHWSRIYELRSSILNGNGLFPKIALNKFYRSGSAVLLMYPYINLIPIVVLSFFIKSFAHLVYLIFILRNFWALILSFFACYSFKKNKILSFIFSISYVLSTMTIFYSFQPMDLGVSSALIYLPLILFGVLNLINDGKWIELTIGLSAVVYCHVITSLMSVIFIMIMLSINFKMINDVKHVSAIFKFLGLTMLITSLFWIPFIIININNSISMPGITWNLYGTDFKAFVSSIFNNSVVDFIGPWTVRYITVVAFLGIVVSILKYKNLEKYDKQLFWVSIFLIFVTSSFFPWNELNDTFIKTTFQFSWRIFVIVQVLLCYLFSSNVLKFCRNKKQIRILLIGITLFVVCTQINGQQQIVDAFQNLRSNLSEVKNDNKYMISDYFPQNSLDSYGTISQHQALEKNKVIQTQPSGNGIFSFKLKHSVNELIMPFVLYKGIDYSVKLDNHNYGFSFDRHNQLALGNLNKGKHTVQVIVHKSWYDYLSYVLSALGVIILAFAWIRLLILKRKNKE